MFHKIESIFILSLLAIVFSFNGHASEVKLKQIFAKYTFAPISGALTTGSIKFKDVTADDDGALWIVTNSGLLKYDGYIFKEINTGIKDPIFSLGVDSKKQLWLGSYNGAIIYDDKQNTFTRYYNGPDNPESIPDESVNNFFLNENGEFWIGTLASITRFNEKSNTFSSFSPWPKDANSDTSEIAASNITIMDITQQVSGLYWLATNQNGLIRFDAEKNKAQIFRTFLTDKIYVKRVSALINLDQDNLLLATNDGLIRFDTQENTFHRFPEDNPVIDRLTDIVRAPNGDIWTGGREVYQITDGSQVIVYKQALDFAIKEKDSHVGKLYIDSENTVYVMYDAKGIYRASPTTSKVKTLSGFKGTNEKVKVLTETLDKHLWVGFGRGLVVAEQIKNGLEYQLVKAKNGNDFNNVTAIHEGLAGTIWIASDIGITSISKTGEIKDYQSPNFLKMEVVSIVQDYLGDVWVSLKDTGIFKLKHDGATSTFVAQFNEQQLSSWSNIWLSLSPDRESLLFVKSSNGFGIFDVREQDMSVVYKTTDISFSYEKKFPLLDSGTWLVNYDQSNNSAFLSHNASYFSTFNWFNREISLKQTQVPRNIIGVIKDELRKDVFWLTSLDDRIYEWSEIDGILSEVKLDSRIVNSGIFNQTGVMLKNGTIIYGGQKGLFWLDSSYRNINKVVPRTNITQIEINNKKYLLNSADNFVQLANDEYSLELSHEQNLLNIMFNGSSTAHPESNQFKYRLKGIYNEWITTSSRNAMFINLPSGDFTFEVMSSNNDGVWSLGSTRIQLRVNPPWWGSYIAYAVYFLLLVALIARREFNKTKQTENLENKILKRTIQLQVSKDDVERLMEEKTRLTEDIYHQTKTPLQLMLSNINNLKQNSITVDDFSSKQSYAIFKLSRLTEKILHITQSDYKPCEETFMHNISEVAEPILLCFLDIAKVKGINFHWSVDNTIVTNCDEIDIERILQNLVENSLKYTEKGEISVTISRHEQNFIIKCSDTGIGIPAAEKDTIFDRYIRASNAKNHPGAGIGLAIIATIVDAYGGNILIDSKENSGSVFSIQLPIILDNDLDDRLAPVNSGSTNSYIKNQITSNVSKILSNIDLGKTKPHILIVEDNIELSVYIKKLLEVDYQISVSLSAEEAMVTAYSQIPDLILSDVMMGGMDGFELTRQIRSCSITKHIPIILVTAKSDNTSYIKGISLGANDFVTKPFNEKQLCKRIQNQLIYVENIQNKALNAEATDDLVNDRLVANYLSLTSKNYQDCDLTIKDICLRLHVSSRQLEKKIKHYLGLTPNEYLNDYRLARAREMIKSGTPIKLVYFECGFSSQSYFSKCYKRKFNITPSAEIVEPVKSHDTKNIKYKI